MGSAFIAKNLNQKHVRLEDLDDRADLAPPQTVLGESFRQRHHIEQFDLSIHGTLPLFKAHSTLSVEENSPHVERSIDFESLPLRLVRPWESLPHSVARSHLLQSKMPRRCERRLKERVAILQRLWQ